MGLCIKTIVAVTTAKALKFLVKSDYLEKTPKLRPVKVIFW